MIERRLKARPAAGSLGQARANDAARATSGVNDAFQVDVVTSLFAVLLLFLLLHPLAETEKSIAKSRFDYAPRQPEAPAFMLRSFASPFGYRDIWFIKFGHLGRLDMREAARRYAASGDLEFGTTLGEADLTVEPGGEALQQYVFRLDIFRSSTAGNAASAKPDLPDALVPEMWAGKDLADALPAFASGPGALIFVWADDLPLYRKVTAMLRTAGVPHEMRQLHQHEGQIVLRMTPKVFELDKILRVY